MTPKVLLVGAGAGSWEVRGRQLGQALGARITVSPMADDFAWADVVVLVKRAIDRWGEAATASKKCVVWDAVDFWQQPEQNQTPVSDLIATVADYQRRYWLSLVIGATRAMAEDVGGVYLPHHYRLSLRPIVPLRPTLTTVAYEGTRKYLGSWAGHVQRACDRLGLQFLINPPDLRIADLVVAFRGEHWDGAVCRRWKSGVKVVNAMACGVPLLSQPSAAFDEIAPPGTVVTSPDEIEPALAHWQAFDRRARARAQAAARVEAYALAEIAREYAAILDRVWRQAA